MKLQHLFLSICTLMFSLLVDTDVMAQQPPSPALQRADLLKKNESKLIYPYIKGSLATGVMPVPDPSFQVDKDKTYKLVFDLWYGNMALYSDGKVNPALEEACRILNLHAGAGLTDKQLDVYFVFHGPGVSTILNEDAYKQRFGKENANSALLAALQAKGVRFVVCGQTLALREIDRAKLYSGTAVGFSARSSLSTLQQRGYVVFDVNDND